MLHVCKTEIYIYVTYLKTSVNLMYEKLHSCE